MGKIQITEKQLLEIRERLIFDLIEQADTEGGVKIGFGSNHALVISQTRYEEMLHKTTTGDKKMIAEIYKVVTNGMKKELIEKLFTERLAEAGVYSSVGTVGDSYDNSLAETINGLCKTEVILRRV